MSIRTNYQSEDISVPIFFDCSTSNATREFLTLRGYSDIRCVRIINLISQAHVHFVFTIFHRGLVNVLCLWGLFGNVITVCVLIKRRLKDTISILLTSIAVFDIVFCATQLLQEVIFILKEYDPVASAKFLSIYMQGIVQWNHLALSSSIYSVAIIGIERLIAVCFPFLVARICTPHRTKWLIVITEVFIFTFSFPAQFLFYEIQWRNSATTAVVRRWAVNPHAIFYWVYLMPLAQVIVPLSVLVTCYAVIVVVLRFSSAKSAKLSSQPVKSTRAKELKMFRLLMILMTVALISFSPPVVVSLTLSYGVLGVQLDSPSFELVMILTKVCSHVFTSANFIIYVTMSSKFAKSFPKLFEACLPTWRLNKCKTKCLW